MAVYNPDNISPSSISQDVVNVLINLRDALHSADYLQQWMSGLSPSDLTAIGFSATDAGTIMSAVADAAALYSLYRTGQPPATYPQAASAYPYSASQSRVIRDRV